MEISSSTTFWKYAVLSLSSIISLVDVVLMSSGIIVLGGAGSTSGAYIVTFIGSLVLTISFLGCFASLRESYILSMLFVGITVVCLILQGIFVISFATMRDQLMTETVDRVDHLWDLELTQPGAMDAMQMQYYCCGNDSAQDYLQSDNDTLPVSCCLYGDCSVESNIYEDGCASTLLNFFNSQSAIVIWTLLSLMLLEVVGLLSSYFLAKSVEHIVQKTEQIIINE